MTEDQIIRKIAVIFVTDVVSFSTLMERNENSTLRSLRACRDIMDQLFKKYDARIFNTAGDSVLAEFQSAVAALVCATEFVLSRRYNFSIISRVMRAKASPPSTQCLYCVRFRIT